MMTRWAISILRRPSFDVSRGGLSARALLGRAGRFARLPFGFSLGVHLSQFEKAAQALISQGVYW
jgi:hypothetical protein